jgi:hypothetical protein
VFIRAGARHIVFLHVAWRCGRPERISVGDANAVGIRALASISLRHHQSAKHLGLPRKPARYQVLPEGWSGSNDRSGGFDPFCLSNADNSLAVSMIMSIRRDSFLLRSGMFTLSVTR